jgi:modulator of FtsH protease
MNPLSPDWANFFVAEVGASAALTGLLVVAISINLSRILAIAQLPGRAAEALIVLVGALALTSAGLVPNQPAALFGAEVLAIGVVTLVVPLAIQLRSWSSAVGVSPARQVVRAIVSAATSLLFIVAGVLLVLGSGNGLYWVAAGVIVALVGGVWNAWVLLVEILR